MGAEGQRSCTGAQNKRSQLAVQALSVSLSLSLSLCVLLSFYAFFASALGVCLHVCGYRVFRCSSVLFFWPTRRAKMAAGHNTLAVWMCVCACVSLCVSVFALVWKLQGTVTLFQVKCIACCLPFCHCLCFRDHVSIIRQFADSFSLAPFLISKQIVALCSQVLRCAH